MILRFKQVIARQPELRLAVDKAIHVFDSYSHTLTVNGVKITPAYLAKKFHLLDNLDLFIADDIADGIHGDVCGQMLKVLRCYNLLEEDATVIVPDKSRPNYNVTNIEFHRHINDEDVDYNPEDYYIGDLLMDFLDELEHKSDSQKDGNIVRIEDLRDRNRS